MSMDIRLRMLSTMVIPGLPVADIGSDHGKLPEYLLQQKLVPYVIATDIKGKPGQRLQERMAGKYPGQLEIRLGDGLQEIKPEEAATVVLAGLGGTAIINIVALDLEKSAGFRRFVFQPMTKAAELRSFCAAQALEIKSEKVCYDSGRYYVMMACERGELPYSLTSAEKEIGPLLLNQTGATAMNYLYNKRQKFQRILAGLNSSRSLPGNNVSLYYQEIITELEKRCSTK